MRSHNKFGPDRFSCFDIYWIQKKQTNRPKYIYIECFQSLLVFTSSHNFLQSWICFILFKGAFCSLQEQTVFSIRTLHLFCALQEAHSDLARDKLVVPVRLCTGSKPGARVVLRPVSRYISYFTFFQFLG